MPYIDTKATIWYRGYVSNENFEIALQLAKDGEVHLINAEIDIEWEQLADTMEDMTPEKNDNQSTIELFRNIESNPIWTNEIKKSNDTDVLGRCS